MKSFVKKSITAAFAVSCFGVLCMGCSHPVYKRVVIHKYDANGKLIGTEVHQGVDQMDPTASPVLPVLESQTYSK